MNKKLASVCAAGVVAVGLTAFGGGTAGAAKSSANTSRSGASTSASISPSATVGDRYAVVDAAGTINRGKGVVSATNLATGQYEVIFNRNITKCAFTATVGSSAFSGIETTGEITTVGRVGTLNGVFLTTSDSTGAFSNRGFHLLVSCLN